MKRFSLYFFSFLIVILLFFIIFFNKISSYTKKRLETYVFHMLPEGSKYRKVVFDFFESYVEEIEIKDYGNAKRIIIKYTPIELLFRKIRCIFIEDAEVFIKTANGLDKKEIKFPKLKVDEIRLKSLKLNFNNNILYVNSTLSLLSIEKQILLRIKKFSCLSDYININDAFGDISITDKIMLNLYSVKTENSTFEVDGTPDSLFVKGELFLQDLIKKIPLMGNVSFKMLYKDKKIFADGYIREINYKDNNLKDITFTINNEKMYFMGKNIEGELIGIFNKKRNLKIRFNKFDLSFMNKNFKETIFSGDILLSMQDSIFSFKSLLKGVFYGVISDTLVLNGSFKDKIINIEKFYLSKGSISSKLVFSIKDTSIYGFINCNGFKINEQPYLRKFLNNGYLSFQISFNGNTTIGSFWLEDINGKNLYVKSGGLNFEIENLKKLNGNFDIFISDASLYERNIDNVYFTGLFNGFDFETKGLIKSNYFTLKTEIAKKSNVVEMKKINIITSNDTFFSISPTRVIFQNGDVNISGFSISNGSDFKTGLNLNLNRNGKIYGGLSVLNLNLKDIRNIINREVSGIIDIVMAISGKLSTPSYTITMKGKNITEEYPFGDSVTIFLSGVKEKAELLLKIFERNKRSEVSGEYDFKNRFFNGNVELNSASNWVFILFKEFVRAEDTDISGSVKFSGSSAFPEVYGNLDINNLNLIEKNSGITIYNLKGKVICEKDIVDFKDFNGGIGNGELNFKGVYKIKDKKYSLNFNIKNGYITYDYYSAGFDCNINLVDDVRGVKLLGDVKVKEGTITLPFYFKEGGNKFDKIYINMNLNVDEGNLWLKNENADIEFSGNAKIFYDWGIPSAIGEFKVLQGSFRYLFTEFKIQDGKFTFSKRGDIDPEIKLLATHLPESNDTIILSVSGSMKKPEFNIYSKPPKDLSEIILILGLNMTWQDLLNISAVDNTMTNTAFRAFDFWARSRLQSEFSKILGMDVAKIEKYESYKLTLGKYITKNLYFQIGTEFYPTAKVEYNAEYRFSNWGTIKYKDTMDSRSVILRFTIRY